MDSDPKQNAIGQLVKSHFSTKIYVRVANWSGFQQKIVMDAVKNQQRIVMDAQDVINVT